MVSTSWSGRDAALPPADAAVTVKEAAATASEGESAATTHGPSRSETARSTRRAVWILVFLAIGFTLYMAASLVLPLLVAALLALLLAPVVGWFNALRLPQAASAGVVVVLLVAIVAGLASYLAAPIQRWTEAGPREMRRLEQRIALVLQPLRKVRQATERVAAVTENESGGGKPREVAVERSQFGAFLDVTVTTLVTVLATVVLLYFLLASGDLFLRKAVRLLPRLRDKIRAVEIAREVQREIGAYFATITLVAIGLGVSTAIAMWLLGMPTPILWGVAVAALNFVPYLGPLIAVVLLSAVALLTFDTPPQIVAPPLAYLALNFIEDQLVVPFALGKRLVMSPVVIFLWLLLCTWMWGVAGTVIAVPLLVAIRISVERIPTLAPVAELLGRE